MATTQHSISIPDLASYQAFLQTKSTLRHEAGIAVDSSMIHASLYPFQRDIVCWALQKGRAAIFADCGLGKTRMQLEWSRLIGKVTLIVAPLTVTEQTADEATDLGISARVIRHQDQIDAPGIYLTNYERLKDFLGVQIDALCLDESSILRSLDGKTRTMLIKEFTHIPYRLCCTATPAPNDIAELANHSAFLGILTREQMLSTFFVQDDQGWRLRGHAHQAFYAWMTSWAVSLKSPADLGYDGSRFVLPPLSYHERIIETDWRKDGELFAGKLHGITDRAQVRQRTIKDRTEAAAAIALLTDGPVVIWCGLNDESSSMADLLGAQAIEVHGSLDPEEKARRLLAFKHGVYRILITKPRIAGRGMNFQHCATQIFVGLSDSWEDYYQCTRRLWRYGQQQPVQAYIVVSDHEVGIVENVRRKEQEADAMTQAMVQASAVLTDISRYPQKSDDLAMDMTQHGGEHWTLWHGDCIEVMAEYASGSFDLSIFSPPFMALYQYTGTQRDIGNSVNQQLFFDHWRFVAPALLRTTKPGRLCVMHLSQVPAMLVRDGYIGFKDFRGPMIQEMEEAGWIFHGEVTIDKNPQAQAIRIKAKGLAFKQLKSDSSWLRPALADMLLLFRAPGENVTPIRPDLTNDEWIRWAHPVWYGIRETHTLNAAEGRDSDDDLHIHPLQLDVIEIATRLWSNPGETIYDPFAGIGSTGYVALQKGRHFVGSELKASYVDAALKNLHRAEVEHSQMSLLSLSSS